jgi:hypothetical protein
VRNAFAALGHDAWSCDLLPSLDGSNHHIQDDVRNVIDDGWDLMMVAHPPCTRLCNSGVRWLSSPPTKLEAGHYSPETIHWFSTATEAQRLDFMWDQLAIGAELFSDLWNAPIPHIAVENPIMHKHAKAKIRDYRKQAQVVQPWHHGDPAFKATALWLRNLEPLAPTNMLTRPEAGTDEHKAWSFIHMASPGPDRWKARSTFFPGIAKAMAAQWSQQLTGVAA